MTERQKRLVNFLLKQYEKDNKRYIPKELIYFSVRNDDDEYMYHNTYTKREGDSYRKEITSDVDTINRLDEKECAVIIISNREGYKIASREEIVEWAQRQRIFIEKKCIKRNNMLKKYKLDGQFDLFSFEIKPFM